MKKIQLKTYDENGLELDNACPITNVNNVFLDDGRSLAEQLVELKNNNNGDIVPVNIEIVHDENSIYVTNDVGKTIHYKFQKEGSNIIQIDNLTDKKTLSIKWRK